jgi:glycosyltransferase involved in cell wall biosynthesis
VSTRAEADRAPINRAGGRQRLHVVGNGVVLPGEPAVYPTGGPPTIGFVGQMDYEPNVDAVCWFADEVLPRIRACVSEATFEIVGRAPTRRVLALARQPGIRVVGAVDDVRPHLNGFAVSVAPLRLGQGIQNKVLEAMASARPVVLTSVAAEGIDAVNRQHFVVADGGAGMADAVVQILREPGRAAAMGAAARSFVADQFSWDRQMAKMEAILLNGGA